MNYIIHATEISQFVESALESDLHRLRKFLHMIRSPDTEPMGIGPEPLHGIGGISRFKWRTVAVEIVRHAGSSSSLPVTPIPTWIG